MSPTRAAAVGAAILCLVAGLTACGDDAPASVAAAPAEDRPGTHILLLGDSVMEELAGPLAFAIEEGGADQADFALGAALPHSPSDVALWESFLDRYDPDVVVLSVGHWEWLKVLGDLATQGLFSYATDILAPALALVRESGAHLLWVSPLPIGDPEESASYRNLSRQFQAAVADAPDAAYLDVTPVIAPDGFTSTLPGPGGDVVEVRRDDGIHLCPEGQLLVAEAIVAELQDDLTAPPDSAWADAWRATVDEPGGCAPYAAPAR